MEIFNKLKLLTKIISYNLKIIFAGYFVYFLIAATIFYLIVMSIMVFANVSPDVGDIYNALIFPGMLIVFYPVVFSIQHDKDSRMLEIIFGVPNYRYKVYMVRFAISIMLLFFILFLMSWFAYFAVLQIPIFEMAFELMYPLVFLACVSFLFSTIIKNGNGTAVVIVIIGLIFWFLSESLENSKWSLFLNPFSIPDEMNVTIWANIVSQNRLILSIGAIVSILWGLINLQSREKFV